MRERHRNICCDLVTGRRRSNRTTFKRWSTWKASAPKPLKLWRSAMEPSKRPTTHTTLWPVRHPIPTSTGKAHLTVLLSEFKQLVEESSAKAKLALETVPQIESQIREAEQTVFEAENVSRGGSELEKLAIHNTESLFRHWLEQDRMRKRLIATPKKLRRSTRSKHPMTPTLSDAKRMRQSPRRALCAARPIT